MSLISVDAQGQCRPTGRTGRRPHTLGEEGNTPDQVGHNWGILEKSQLRYTYERNLRYNLDQR